MENEPKKQLEAFTKEKAILKVLDKERGYVDNPKDPGGATNLGITLTTASANKHLWKDFDWDGNMKTMPKAFAIKVYEIKYWNSLSLDAVSKLSSLLADALFDIGVNAGVARAGMWLQRLLNVSNRQGSLYPDIIEDGNIGPASLRALRSFFNARGDDGLKVLLSMLICLKGAHYVTITERNENLEEFLYGWGKHRIFDDMNLYMDLID